MTVDALAPAATPTMFYTVGGIGPYAVTYPYDADTLQVFAQVADAWVRLTVADYTVTPTDSSTTGNVFLTPAAAATHAGRALMIDRITPDEQGWVGQLGEREAGLEAQLDRIIYAAQELRGRADSALRVAGAILPPILPGEGRTIIWQSGAFVEGPDATDIANAQSNASTATAAAASASASAGIAALYSPPRFNSLAALIASTLTYALAPVGSLVMVKDRPYQVMTAGTADADITNASNVLFNQEVDASGAYSIEGYTGTDTERLERFIRKANARGGNCALVFDATKTYSIPAQVGELVTSPNVSFLGNNARLTIDKGEVIRYGKGTGWPAVIYAEGGEVSGFRLTGAAGTDATSKFVRICYGGRITVSNIDCQNVATLLDSDPVDPVNTSNASITVQNIEGGFANVGNCPAIRRGRTFAFVMDTFLAFNIVPPGEVAAVNRIFLDDSGTTVRSTMMVSNGLAERFYIGLRIAPTGVGFVDYLFQNVVLDSMYNTAWLMECGAGGAITSILGTNVWATGLSQNTGGVTNVNADSSAKFIATAAGSFIGAMHLTNCWFNGGYTRNVEMSGGIRNVVLANSQAASYEAPVANKVILALDNTQGRMEDIKIIGNNLGGQRNTFTTFNADYGLNVGGTAPIKGLHIIGNTIGGELSHLLLPIFATADRSMLVRDNVFVGPGSTGCGWRPAGGLFVVPATNVAWVNRTAQVIEITTSGGTVTQLLLLDALSNTQVAVPFTGTHRLNPGDQITPTYSVVPVWQFRAVG